MSKVKGWTKGTGTYEVKETVIEQGNQVVNGGFDNIYSWLMTPGSLIEDGVLKLIRTDTSTFAYQNNVLTANKRYRVTLRAKVVSGDSPRRLAVYMGLGSTSNYFYVEGDWKTYSFEKTVPENAIAHKFYLETNLGSGEIHIDDVYVVEIPQLPTITTGTKYLECTSPGTTAIQSKQAYGEWEFDLNKGADGNIYFVGFVNSDTTFGGTNNGYNFAIDANENVRLQYSTAGTRSNLFYTANSYIDINTWYRCKVVRLPSEGVFKDIPTLQTSDLANSDGGTRDYTIFTSYGRYGFRAACDNTDTRIAGTADEISLISSAKYLVEFDLKLNSGTAPDIALKANTGLAGNISNTVTTVNGRNSIILTATITTTGAVGFSNVLTETDYEISGLTIRRIYDDDTFAVFIKGGVYGNTETGWTLVDTTGGSGSNPVTNSTYTTSEYLVLDLDTQDKIANIKLTDGVEQ